MSEENSKQFNTPLKIYFDIDKNTYTLHDLVSELTVEMKERKQFTNKERQHPVRLVVRSDHCFESKSTCANQPHDQSAPISPK